MKKIESLQDEFIKIKNSDFVQKIIKLDGDPWRLRNRPYIFPVFDGDYRRFLLYAARQVEKSTTISGLKIANCCLNNNISSLYVSPTGKQTGVFSRKKIDEAFEVSPFLKKIWYPGHKGFRIEEKRLKNYSTMYFRSAYHDADSIRGITAHRNMIDEIQDILSDVIPVIETCSQRVKNPRYYKSGTAKTFDNNIELEWQKTNQCEWHVRCLHCGYYNMLGIENVLVGKPGLWCRKCNGDIHSIYGIWVAGKPENDEYLGVRLPYIILPEDEIDWKELFWKMKNYNTASLMNEVFGVAYDNGQKPLTREQLQKACDPQRHIWRQLPPQYSSLLTYAGIDWGGGNTSLSVITIGYYDQTNNKFKEIYKQKFTGELANPDNMIPEMARLINLFNCHIVGADYGFGFGLNEQLKKCISQEYVYIKFMHGQLKKIIAWNDDSESYITNRTEVMTEYFNRIKDGKHEFFRYEDFEDFGKDYLNIYSEYSEKTGRLRYDHTKPDDAFQSGLYCLLAWMLHTKQMPTTRYSKQDDEEEVGSDFLR